MSPIGKILLPEQQGHILYYGTSCPMQLIPTPTSWALVELFSKKRHGTGRGPGEELAARVGCRVRASSPHWCVAM